MVAALILAGGRSSRFGSEKSLHLHHQKALILHVVRAVRAGLNPTHILVGVDHSAQRPALLQILASEGEFDVIDDDPTLQGPMASLSAGLSHAKRNQWPWLFVCACDMPGLTPALLAGLWDNAQHNPDINALVPEAEGYLQPLCAFYRPAPSLKGLHRYAQTGRRALQGFVEVLEDVARVSEEELAQIEPNWRQALVNVNRQSDLKLL